MWRRFREVLNTAKVYAISLKKQTQKEFPSWETAEVRKARRLRNKTERKYLLDKTQSNRIKQNESSKHFR